MCFIARVIACFFYACYCMFLNYVNPIFYVNTNFNHSQILMQTYIFDKMLYKKINILTQVFFKNNFVLGIYSRLYYNRVYNILHILPYCIYYMLYIMFHIISWGYINVLYLLYLFHNIFRL